MLWKILLSLAALFSRSSDVHREENSRVEPHEFTPSLDGPQTWEEAEIAHNAIHGDKFGGDMVFPEGFSISDAGMNDTKFRWPGYPGSGVVPYIIDRSLGASRGLIRYSMDQIEKKTCIKFVPRTNETDYVRIYAGDGCWSVMGRAGNGEQNLSLAYKGCLYKGTVIHELGHAIGLYHEHQRSDRDDYINVYLKNVVAGREDQFTKIDPVKELIFTKYDYRSIMHYGNYAFSKQPNRLATMIAKDDGPRLLEPHDKAGLTNSDIETIKKLYECE